MQPDTTIVLITWSPTEHRLSVLRRSLQSLYDYTTVPYHLVVIDNGPQMQTEWLHTQKIDTHITPATNIGIGLARNMGAAVGNSTCLAFVDNDIEYFPGWLGACIEALEKCPGKYLATPIFSAPMKNRRKYYCGTLNGYEVWARSSPQAWVMRRSDYETLGRWVLHSQPGSEYCDRLTDHGYRILWHPTWTARHLCNRASYDHKSRLVNGVWIKKPGHVWWKGAWMSLASVAKKRQMRAQRIAQIRQKQLEESKNGS